MSLVCVEENTPVTDCERCFSSLNRNHRFRLNLGRIEIENIYRVKYLFAKIAKAPQILKKITENSLSFENANEKCKRVGMRAGG